MAKNIMIQGTMSNAGKSLLAAGLCRIFKQDGYRVAPFKSQNMALNSFITEAGGEMGRAQVVQAEAAGVKPDVRMNPILLKPTTDVGSQVIVNGVAMGNMRAMEYYRRKREFIPQILEAYNGLAAENDIIVIEGAGSPAEINLKQQDIVNMGMAELVDAPVLLVGDIDRGGVFAQLYGTIALLEENERKRIKGTVVNKFRGDRAILQPGIDILEKICGVPVAGVIPYTHVDIDDEDSLSEKIENKEKGLINIAVVRLPRISNFTDFDVFSQYEGVSVRYASKPGELEGADMMILPGTKSTLGDMKWLRESGMEAMIKKLNFGGVPVFGVCGGYQMLGRRISDPENTEGGGEAAGMGLLDCETVFRSEKTRTRISGKIQSIGGFFSFLSDRDFSGYEIHMGETSIGGNVLSELDNGRADGSWKGNVCGSYVHGIFDSADISGEIVKALFRSKGLEYGAERTDRKSYKERQYKLLADNVRANLDMELIYKILRKEV